MCLINKLGDVDTRIPFFELVWVNENSLVAHILGTLDECLRILGLDIGLNSFGIPRTDAVPKFGFSVVVVIDTAQIIVFGVTSKHRPQSTDIEIRSVYPIERFFAEPITC